MRPPAERNRGVQLPYPALNEKEIVEKLRKEIKRFYEKLDLALPKIYAIDSKGDDLLLMAKAYFKDTSHFLEKEDLVSAFEALNISWGYLDAGLRTRLLKLEDEKLKEWFTID